MKANKFGLKPYQVDSNVEYYSSEHQAMRLLYEEATAWYSTRSLSSTDQQSLPNLVNSAADDAQMGSTTGSDTNDPTRFPHDGTNYVWHPGVGSAAAVRIASGFSAWPSIANVVRLEGGLIYDGLAATGNPRALIMRHWVAGGLGVLAIEDGLVNFWVDRSAGDLFIKGGDTLDTLGYAAGDYVYVAGEHTFSTGETTLYHRPSEEDEWEPIYTSTVAASAPSQFPPSDLLPYVVGGNATSDPCRVFHSKAIIDGATVLEFQPEDIVDSGASSFTTTSGHTATVLRGTSGLITTVVTEPVLVTDGSDDYVLLPDTPTLTASTGEKTVLAVLRMHGAANAFDRIWSAEDSNNDGMSLRMSIGTRTFRAHMGGSSASVTPIGGTLVDGQVCAVGGRWDDGTLVAYVYGDGTKASTPYTGVGTISYRPARLGNAAYAASQPFTGELFEVVEWDRALTEAELDAVAEYLGAEAL